MVKPARQTNSQATPVITAITTHWEKLVGVTSVLTAAVTALIYAVTLNTNALYANALGLTPEDLGVTQTGLLAAALMYAFIVAITVVLTAASFGLGRTFTRLVGHWASAHWPLLKRLRMPKRTTALCRLSPKGWLKLVAQAVADVLLAFAPVVITITILFASRQLLDGEIGYLIFLTAASFGFGSSACMYSGLAAPSAPNRTPSNISLHAWVALGLSLLVVLTTITGTIVSALSNSALSRAATLLNGPVSSGPEAFADPFLAGQRSDARMVPITATDPLNLCDGKKVVTLLSATPDANIVIVYPEPDKPALGVYRAPLDTYVIITGLEQPAPCKRSNIP